MPKVLQPPTLDPAPIFKNFRGNYAMELLTAGVAHLGVFDRLAAGPLARGDLRQATGLAERPFSVLLTGLKALGLLEESAGRVQATYPALFSVALLMMTEGRNYSGAEYRAWLAAAGFVPGEVQPTLVHSSVLVGTKG